MMCLWLKVRSDPSSCLSNCVSEASVLYIFVQNETCDCMVLSNGWPRVVFFLQDTPRVPGEEYQLPCLNAVLDTVQTNKHNVLSLSKISEVVKLSTLLGL